VWIVRQACRSRTSKRHQYRRNCSSPSKVSTELLGTIPEVLSACGIRINQLGEWEKIDFSRLRNIRQSQPEPSRKHTQWQYTSDSTLGLRLPSLETVLVGIIVQVSTQGIGEEAQIFRDNEICEFTPKEWTDWATAVLEGQTVPKRILNMSSRSILGVTER